MFWKRLAVVVMACLGVVCSPQLTWADVQQAVSADRNRPEDDELRILVDRIKGPCKPKDTSRDLIRISRFGNRAESAIPYVASLLKCEFPNVRAAAAHALGTIGPPEKVIPHITTALKDEIGQVRESAAAALGRIGPGASQAVPHLVELLKDDLWRVRKASAEALGRIGDKTAVPPLIQTLNEPKTDPAKQGQEVRAAAARALGRIGDKRAIKPLLDSVKNDREIRRISAEALKDINAPGALRNLDN